MIQASYRWWEFKPEQHTQYHPVPLDENLGTDEDVQECPIANPDAFQVHLNSKETDAAPGLWRDREEGKN